ncbi:MSMEG_6728 family protein [Arthrobacter sp. L77]|uniref:MSMEG_6728 family protein n=1 Tax=Arthrobacter sp. L77 TaxID=1496689 RepID=UPI0005B9C0D5|nr:MSMEG_6728 family protein [Arthrobacter sp. L77]
MQTFLPYPDVAASARVLDQARLGKQRVETLQVLRALVIPDYGWRQHPAIRMWMGYVPALTVYGLAMVAEWVSRGHADSTYRQILEFAPDVLDQPDVPMPPWFGDPALHVSHQSNLVQKAPEIYRDRFPGIPGDLPYVWPAPERERLPVEPTGRRLWIWRADRLPGAPPADTDDPDDVVLLMPPVPPGGHAAPKWERQLHAFEESVEEGDAVAIADPEGRRFRTGRMGRVFMHEDGLVRTVRLDGRLERSDIHPPALLQDPRTLFGVDLPDALQA